MGKQSTKETTLNQTSRKTTEMRQKGTFSLVIPMNMFSFFFSSPMLLLYLLPSQGQHRGSLGLVLVHRRQEGEERRKGPRQSRRRGCFRAKNEETGESGQGHTHRCRRRETKRRKKKVGR